MAKVSLDLEEYVAIEGGGLCIELLLRRLNDLEKFEIGEMFAAERQHVVTEQTPDGKLRRETSIIQEPGRGVRGIQRLLDLCVVDWRNVQGDGGVPLPYTQDALKNVTACYPAWGSALTAKLNEFSGLEATAEIVRRVGADPTKEPGTSQIFASTPPG